MGKIKNPPRIITNDGSFIMSPKIDFAFKLLFGDEKNKDITISFLMAILKIRIIDINIKDPFLLKEIASDKTGVLDIRIVLDSGVQVDVEIQLTSHLAIRERILFYWSKLYLSQISSGEQYHVLKKTISIIFLDYTLLPVESMHTRYRMYDNKNEVELTDTIEVHLIELPKLNNLIEQDKTNSEIPWLRFINAETKEDLIMAAEAEPKVAKAYHKLTEMSEDKEARRRYDERMQYIVEIEMRMQAAEEKGIQEGIQKGKQEGIQEGRKEGREEGKTEERFNLAKNLINLGMDDNIIMKATGLDLNTITRIRSEQ
jgi:predicted transposase/invertase (TIGR01784 family)